MFAGMAHHVEPPSIAIVDDDDAVRSATQLLAESLGWSARTYATAQSFLDEAADGHADCLILDLQMPGVNGAELLEILKKQHLSIPVVVITALKDDPLVARARAQGVSTVLTKPFRDDVLVSVVEQLLGRAVT